MTVQELYDQLKVLIEAGKGEDQIITDDDREIQGVMVQDNGYQVLY